MLIIVTFQNAMLLNKQCLLEVHIDYLTSLGKFNKFLRS